MMYIGGEDGEDRPPLLGVVLCCTSILPEQRTQLAALASQMGATHKLDLTSDVTHLIVGNIDTPKYKYVAKERQDIKVLQVDWLEAVRASWIEGGLTDVAALEQQYRLPTLYNLQICVTGFDDLDQRTAIQEAVAANGATYHGDLTKNVTHLIAAHPSGRKYEYAGQWHIRIVSLDWLHKSLDRGMALDESLFHPLMPADERGRGAIADRKPPSPVLGKRSRQPDNPSHTGDPGRRKLRRSASNRLGSQGETLWADISSADAEPKTNPARKSLAVNPDSIVDQSEAHDANEKHRTALDTRIKRQQPSKNQSSGGSRGTPIFQGISPAPQFFLHGFDERRSNVLANVITTNGGCITSEQAIKARTSSPSEEDAVVIIVPHAAEVAASAESYGWLAFQELVANGLATASDHVVTEFWIEQCLFHHRFLEPAETPLCVPFKTVPIEGFENLKICPTSFAGCDLLHFSKTAKLMGAEYDEYLRKDSSVLVCHDTSANPGKLRYALENHIPVVSAAWFHDCVHQGITLSFEDYALSTSRQSQRESQPCFYHPVSNPRQPSRPARPPRGFRDGASARRGSKQGRLALARTPQDNTPADDMPQSNSAFEESFETADEFPGVLQDLSPSKQNSQTRTSTPSNRIEDARKSPKQVQVKNNPNIVEIGSFNNYSEADVSEDPRTSIVHPAQLVLPLISKPGNAETEASTSSHSLVRNADNLSNALAAVLAQRRKMASFQGQTKSFTSEVQSNGSSRRQRTLGRAPSNGSHAMSSAQSLESRPGMVGGPSDSTSYPLAENEIFDPELETDLNRLRREDLEKNMFRPSQALSYEDPDAAAAKEELLRRVNAGGAGNSNLAKEDSQTMGNPGQRVESIGTVKDAAVADEKKKRPLRRK